MLRNGLQSNINLLTKFIVTSCSTPFAGTKHGRRVFDSHTHIADTFLCNSMIKAYSDNNQFSESITLYRDLCRNEKCGLGFSPDTYTYPFLFKACWSSLAFKEGYQLHSQVLKMGLCYDVFVSTTLVDMYVKFGNIVSGSKLFDEMPEKSEVCCTALIVGYARSGDMGMSRKLFDGMFEKDSVAFNAIIDGYVKEGNVVLARELFDRMPERNVVSWTTLISGYCKNGDLAAARSLFDAMPEKNLVSWNTIIGGYCQNKKPHEAMELFRKMQSSSSFEPDEVTIVSILPAVADLGALDFGGWVHEYVRRKKLDRANNVCTALLDMYAKCGEILKAKQLFDSSFEIETTTWNAMINGFAVNGCGKEALELFLEMLKEGHKPNGITMIGVLCACNHGGLVEDGRKWFKAMKGFGITPGIEHYGCMVDILGRAGYLKEAEELIKSMPYEVNGIILSSFLFSCGCHRDVTRAEKVMRSAFKMEPWNDGNYVMMRNLYARERRWRDVEEVKGLMRKNRAKREVGCSVIEVDSTISEFVAGERVHPQLKVINRVLRQLQLQIEREYEEFKIRINALVAKALKVPPGGWIMQDGTPWPGNNTRDHPGMIQVFLGHSGGHDTEGNELPRLVYVSREKRPGFHHHKKVGAMNALIRVSAVLTNAPFILNLDCNHYINNSKAAREAMCFLMDPQIGRKVCYVQFPQRFDGIDRNDRYANRNTVFFDINMKGLDGIQGLVYVGTGCVFRRQALYGYEPPKGPKPPKMVSCDCCPCFGRRKKLKYSKHFTGGTDVNGNAPGLDDDKELMMSQMNFEKRFGQSAAFVTSTLMEQGGVPPSSSPAALLKEAIHVISCGYEDKTEWGTKVRITRLKSCPCYM
ncbi:hypothetical protein GIB67_016825 [Kingdonia uniflora]|uniref:cellulose synthase (UDP-forming) n=1 Tax=Kingdonia uniflora TaxID=39325 RepID=A0A7J7LQ12_9MAGN|nr:hypothetical protein GIB67_016825 [Kingdonia uniflora]